MSSGSIPTPFSRCDFGVCADCTSEAQSYHTVQHLARCPVSFVALPVMYMYSKPCRCDIQGYPQVPGSEEETLPISLLQARCPVPLSFPSFSGSLPLTRLLSVLCARSGSMYYRLFILLQPALVESHSDQSPQFHSHLLISGKRAVENYTPFGQVCHLIPHCPFPHPYRHSFVRQDSTLPCMHLLAKTKPRSNPGIELDTASPFEKTSPSKTIFQAQSRPSHVPSLRFGSYYRVIRPFRGVPENPRAHQQSRAAKKGGKSYHRKYIRVSEIRHNQQTRIRLAHRHPSVSALACL
jgi:hypothetical protein